MSTRHRQPSNNLLYGFKAPRKRGARRSPGPRAAAPVSAPLRPAARPAPHSDSGRWHSKGQNAASGGGAPAPGWTGLVGGCTFFMVEVVTPIPPAIDPGQAEQPRSRASRSFVQWRAPP